METTGCFRAVSLGLSSRLAYPVDFIIDARTSQHHEVLQHELITAVQNEVSRRAEPLELQRMDRETERVQ